MTLPHIIPRSFEISPFAPPSDQHDGSDRSEYQQRDRADHGEQSYQPHHVRQLALALNIFCWLFILHLFGV